MLSRLDAPIGWSARGLALRNRNEGDRAFLRDLYGAFRADEMEPVPWPEPLKAQFLNEQFALQTLHFDRFHANADFLIVEDRGLPIGRFYLDRKPDGFLVIDIGFLPHRQGGGLGAALLRHAHKRAAQRHAGRVWLHVSATNHRAQQLYERLGFRVTEGADANYRTMEWEVS